MYSDPTLRLAIGDDAASGRRHRREPHLAGLCAPGPMKLVGPVTMNPPNPSSVRPPHQEEQVLKPLIYGYLRVTEDLHDHEIRAMERGLRKTAEAGGFCFATTFHEDQPGCHGGFDELIRELQRAQAHHVVMPSVEHLSAHPMLRTALLTRLSRDANARLWVVTQP